MKKLFFFFLFVLSVQGGHAKIFIDVNGGQLEPVPIAVQVFEADKKSLGQKAKKITEIIENDLQNTGLIRIIPKDSHIANDRVGNFPTYADWKVCGAHLLLQGRLYEEDSKNMRLDFYLWDVGAKKQITSQALVSLKTNERRLGHITADAIYEVLTGEKGYFDTRIVYISETGRNTSRIKRLAIMDYDGENHKYLTDGRVLVLTPTFQPGMQKIAFMSYYNNVPRVYLFNLQTGKQETIGNFPGMTYAPSFHPNGKNIILSMDIQGNSEIYDVNLETKERKKLTENTAIDTSPSYSPDGKSIVFNSDRGGSPQIYKMNADGSGVERISFGDGRYFTPVYSPKGDYVAFTKIKGNTFYVGVMLPNGEGERILAKGFSVEGPTWAPNGRRLMYFKQIPDANGFDKVRLHSVDITGLHEYEVKTPQEASDPAWSPLLP
ncbi:MAG: Tol-Pal system protein TolB [Alphaproteobacteria bacterium]|nr:Tol-Pal system protein TolB [Alphaproteobacteria bacterium]